MFGCLHYGRCCAGGENVDPALAPVRINIILGGWDLIIAHKPLPLGSLYRRLLHDWTEDESACLEVYCFSKLSGEGKQLKSNMECQEKPVGNVLKKEEEKEKG